MVKDPIFTLIADFHAAEKATRDASRALEELETRLDEEDDAKNAHIPHPARARLRRTHVPMVGISGEGWGVFASSKEDVVAAMERKYRAAIDCHPEARTALLLAREQETKDWLQRLAKVRRERAKGWRSCGITKARQAYEDADRAASIATREMCRTKPTTIAGLAALLDVLHTQTKDGAGDWDYYDGRSKDIYKTVAVAAHALAGDNSARRVVHLRPVTKAA